MKNGRNLFAHLLLPAAVVVVGCRAIPLAAQETTLPASPTLGGATLESHLREADRAAAAGQTEAAVDGYAEALAIDPGNIKALKGIGATLDQRGNLAAAEPYFRQALKLSPENAFLHSSLGRILVEEGNLEEAADHFEAAIRLDGHDANATLQLALLSMGIGDFARALDLFTIVLNLRPLDPVALLERPRALRALGRDLEALATLDQALALLPDDPAVALSLGIALMNTNPDRARSLLSSVIAKPTAHVSARGLACYNRGVLSAQEGNDPAAKKDFEAAVGFDASLAAARFHLANAIARTGDYTQAAQHYSELLRLEPDHVPGRLAHATALNLDHRCLEAVNTLQDGLLATPGDLNLSHTLAQLLTNCPDGDPQRALELAQMVFRRSPTFEHGETVALCWAALGAYEQAVKWQRELIKEAALVGDTDWSARLEAGLDFLAGPGGEP